MNTFVISIYDYINDTLIIKKIHSELESRAIICAVQGITVREEWKRIERRLEDIDENSLMQVIRLFESEEMKICSLKL